MRVYAASLCHLTDEVNFDIVFFQGGSPNSTGDAVLLDCRFLRVGSEDPRVPKTIFGWAYLQQWREIWISHGHRWPRFFSQLNHRDKVLALPDHVMWGSIFFENQILGR